MFRLIRAIVKCGGGVVALWNLLIKHLSSFVGSDLMGIVLLCRDIVMLLWSRLSLGLLNGHGHIAMHTMDQFRSVWLHLQDKVTLLNVGLRATEDSAVGIKGSVVRLVPLVCVDGPSIVHSVLGYLR